MHDIPASTSGRTAAEVARQAALRAGEMLLESFRKHLDVSYKEPGQIVTQVDKAVEDELRSMLGREYPDFGFLGEESEGTDPSNGYVWVVDPLDGTRNYAFGVPFFSTVIGLVLDGRTVVGVNYDPFRNDLFEAQRGVGAFLNGDPIKVSAKTKLEDCTIGLDLAYASEGGGHTLDVVRAIWPEMQTARIMGSSALGISYAAAGLTDIYFHHRLQPWDMVAGLLLVEEAGGVVTDRTGEPAGLYYDGLVASSETLHAEFMRRTEGMPWRTPTHRLA